MSDTKIFTEEILKEINNILKHGDTVELKRESGKIVIIEIRRKRKLKLNY